MTDPARAILLLTLTALAVPGALGASAETGAHDPGTLPYPIQRLLLSRKVSQDSLSVFVQDVTSDEPLLAVAADTPRNPASAIKLLTTYAALEALGPAYQWQTTALHTAPLRNGRLEGDLYLRGGGDPFLVTERFWKLLLGLRNSGLRHIAGDLVIDSTYFEVEPVDPGAFDGKPFRPYNVGPDALLINFGVTRFWFVPDAHNARVDVIPEPPSATMKIDNRLSLGSERCVGGPTRVRLNVLSRDDGGSVQFVGSYPEQCGRFALTRAVTTPLPSTFGTFKAMWQDLGGTLEGGYREAVVPAGARHLHTELSPPIAELIRPINKYSNNVMSRHFFLTLGAERLGPPGTLDKGRRAMAEWLASVGLDFPELVMDNGAGLSRDTRISARSLGRVLLRAHRSPYMPEFIASLPLSAIDGTLARRFNGEDLEGHVHLKTGTLDNVKAMGGYILTRSGRTLVVVSLHNYPGIQGGFGTQVQDALLRWLFKL